MIRSLHISNYALIDSLDIEFSAGLNIITGETGAGKSIMLGALGLLLGARADSRAIRRSDSKSVVEAVFNVVGNDNLARWAADAGLDWDGSECILRRELSPAGRTRAFINDTPVTVAQLAEIGSRLIDLHSQNQNQLLAAADYQLRVVDSIAGNAALYAQYQADYALFKAAERQLADARGSIERARADEEFIAFRLAQLDDARLVAGEQEELQRERELQSNMSRIKELLVQSLASLNDGDCPAVAAVSEAADAVRALGDYLEDAAALADRLDSAQIEINDIAETLAAYDADLGVDVGEIDAIDERLNLLYTLESRHGVDSVEKLIEIREDLRSRLDSIADGDMIINELAAKAASAKKAAIATARKLSVRRKEAAQRLAVELFEKASPLGMPNLRCFVEVAPARMLLPSGIDNIEFRFAFNKNQTPVAVGGAASGGEVSRLMLAVKSIVSERLQLPTIIFDEVDTGVSGDVANRMGDMMVDMSQRLQVITITHLPQVAAKGGTHHKVYKEDDADATHTRIRSLSPAEREGELALMLSGSAGDAAALAAARALLKRK